MESFTFMMDLACWLKPGTVENLCCNNVNVMDGEQSQQFGLSSTISQSRI